MQPASPRPRATRAGHSRAQRYALGAAVAASIGVAKADTPKDGSPVAASDADADADASQPPPLRLEPPQHQGGGPCQRVGGCCNSQVVCPPYGCVFPDDGCDVVHV